MNARMRSALQQVNPAFGDLPLAPSLTRVIDSGFIQVDGVVFLKALLSLAIEVSSSSFPDETGFECFVNHFHIEDYLDSTELLAPTLVHGILFMDLLYSELSQKFSRERFEIILSMSEEGDCIIRFHKIRTGQTWLNVDLESYMEEGVMTLTTSD